MVWLKQNWHKILVVVLMFVALGDHPYGYYQFLRWITVFSAGYLAYKSQENKKTNWFWVFLAIAILFNPVLPIYQSKSTWGFFNVAVGIIYIISIISIISSRSSVTQKS